MAFDIFDDKIAFPDELEIPIGDRKVKLGDLRAMTAKQQRELAEKLTAATERERTALEMSEKAAGIFNNLKKMEDDAKALEASRPTGETDDFDTNNWWTPARKRITAQEQKITDALSKVQTLTDSFTKAATMFATDRWNSQFDRVAPKLKKSKEYADWDVARVRDYATKNNVLDEFGFPSVEKAVALLTRVDDIEEAKKAAFEEGKKEAQRLARMAAQARPTSNTGGKTPKGKSAVEDLGLEGLGDDVANDEELMDMLSRTQAAFDPGSLQ